MVKPPKLTPEERKQIKEIKKLAAKKAAVETKKQIKRDQLSRELKFGKINRAKLKNIWKQTLYNIKIPVLKTEFELAINNADRVLDNKDFVISLLMDELDKTEEQHKFNFRAYSEKIDKLFNIFSQRLDKMKQEYDSELSDLQNSLQQQDVALKQKHEEAEEFLKTMMYALSVKNKVTDNNERAIYVSKINEAVRKYTDELALYQKWGEDKFEMKWKTYVTYLEKYVRKQMEIFDDYDKLFKRDNYLTNVIKKQNEEIIYYNSLRRTTKDQSTNEKDKLNTKIDLLKSEHQFFSCVKKELKYTFSADQNEDARRLTFLVIESNAAIQKMREIIMFAEKILRYYSLVRKHETFKEKLLPYPQIEPVTIHMEEDVAFKLGPFWQKYSQGQINKHQVQVELSKLKDENKILKGAVKTCLNYECSGRVPEQNLKNRNWDAENENTTHLGQHI